MAEVFPSALIQRDSPNLRLGIKSSLNSFRQLIASLYVIYKSTPSVTKIQYTDEYNNAGVTNIKLSDILVTQIESNFSSINNIVELINNSPLFKSQLEALQVGIELFLRIGKIDFKSSSRQERTGNNRYNKVLSFSDKMVIIDAYLSAYNNTQVTSFLSSWLQDNSVNENIEDGMKNILSTFIIDCCYKIKKSDGSEVVFNIENIYKELAEGNDVLFQDGETVGPMRVLNSYISENMLPYIEKKKNLYKIRKGKENTINGCQSMTTTSLDLINRKLPIDLSIIEDDKIEDITITKQVIYFGAPGTGKSYAVSRETGGKDNPNVVRTTFHPDSDYSTFVGCYKPTKRELSSAQEKATLDELKAMADNIKNKPDGERVQCITDFLCKYAAQIMKIVSDNDGVKSLNSLIRDLGFSNDTYLANIVHKALELQHTETEITYEFVPQAFTKAYVDAWKNQDEMHYLVIEEINRGNCAQVFGDIFQLLDRSENGESDYSINSDKDLQQYLKGEFEDYRKLPEEIRSGEKMRLPANLSIIATMNTSDQSLFPIDSAFKRRWQWKYIPIKDEKKGHKIKIADKTYDWGEFIKAINEKIDIATHSEDKQLGYWFVDMNEVDAETFVSKVVFYLWNDIFKDRGNGESNVFNIDGKKYTFRSFFDVEGNVDTTLLQAFFHNINVNAEQSTTTEKEPYNEKQA